MRDGVNRVSGAATGSLDFFFLLFFGWWFALVVIPEHHHHEAAFLTKKRLQGLVVRGWVKVRLSWAANTSHKRGPVLVFACEVGLKP